ncbi:MAG TPA: hypothetical protein H9687_05885 [Firmicutes bacterium]|nr:hypothetical protein [Bacillota bacterium]
MKLYFTPQEQEQELHKVYLEEDEVTVYGQWIEGEGSHYVLTGTAEVDGEIYHDFQVEIALVSSLAEPTAAAVMQAPWQWYDYLL